MRRFPLSPEGWFFLVPALILAFAALLIQWYIAALLFFTIAFFAANFFRDPHRKGSERPVDVLSPADGTVVDIREVDEKEAGEGLTRQISIVTSIFDVYVNRAPLGGTVVRLTGGTEPQSGSRENLMVIEGGGMVVGIRQVAGLLARQLIVDKREGDLVARGERIGTIPFGSRVDVFLPPEARINVKMRDRVKVGVTVLAELEKER